MSELCPAFDEKKAKTNGHICILVSESVDRAGYTAVLTS